MPHPYVPPTIRTVFDKITVPGKVLSGIGPDPAHLATGGYHCARIQCRSTDYSVQLAVDKLGDPYAYCALDISFRDIRNHYLVAGRMMTAFKTGDPRIWPMREYLGSVNGLTTTGWDRHDPTKLVDDTYRIPDATHKWHSHLDWYRGYVLDPRWVQGVADVINGVPLPRSLPTLLMPWPVWMQPGHVFGDIDGPEWVHGGAVWSERDEVQAIQRQLNAKTGSRLADDGLFGPASTSTTKAFQRSRGITPDGLVGKTTWAKLFAR